jgi:hypothetical protein
MHRFILVVFGLVAALVVLPLASTQPSHAQPTYADPSFQATRDRLDLPVDTGHANRTWIWGPEPITEGVYEPYAESPGGERLVQYMDKARFELTDPDGDTSSPWYVTTGLLTRELITGSIQVGHGTYEQHAPSSQTMAGDATNTWPTYAGFASVIDRLYDDMTGQQATSVLLEDGISSFPDAASDPAAQLVQYLTYDGPTGPAGYNLPAAFWDFMHAPGITWDGIGYGPVSPLLDWLFVLGLPISDPFWVSVELQGETTWVLVQAFERRVLTYTPTNPVGWQVEMGNVGRHYAEWRHGNGPPPVFPSIPPIEHNPGAGSDYFAMQVGNIWAYQDTGTGEYTVVEIAGRTTEFIEGAWLLVRAESRADGSQEISYWDTSGHVLWLYGHELFDPDSTLVERVVYDPPVRYLLSEQQPGTGWATNTWVDVNGIQSRLVQLAFQVMMQREITTAAGMFEATSINATEALTDGDLVSDTPALLKRFDFAPYYGIVQESRADGSELELVAYSLN